MGRRFIEVIIDSDTAQRLLDHLELAERVPVKFSWVDASEWHQALKDALKQDEGEDNV